MCPNQGVHVTDGGYGYDSKGGGIEEVGNDECAKEV
jgi:hypothetical protein